MGKVTSKETNALNAVCPGIIHYLLSNFMLFVEYKWQQNEIDSLEFSSKYTERFHWLLL
jgi:hypothetical protein